MGAIFIVKDQGITLNICVQPGAKQNQFAGKHLDRLKVKVRAKAVDGAANDAVLNFVAQHFQVSKSCIQIIRGFDSREKTLEVIGNPNRLKVIAQGLTETIQE